MQYFLIRHMQVQNANAVAGFTYGYPGITHFLGFVNLLNQKLQLDNKFSGIELTGCAVISHSHQLHTFRTDHKAIKFTQSRNPPYLNGLADSKKSATASIIEEGKMNLTVSLLIRYQGNIGKYHEKLENWLKHQIFLHRLAGGTILAIESVSHYRISDNDVLNQLKRQLLPAFFLLERNDLLAEYVQKQRSAAEKKENNCVDMWLDFVALKQQARPKYDLIDQHLTEISPQLLECWQAYLREDDYSAEKLPTSLIDYFNNLPKNKANKAVLAQWQSYVDPNQTTDADWRYLPKPAAGYLVPIMSGYKAISAVLANDEVENTRDNSTDICFVEAIHTVGEWKSVHRIRSVEELEQTIWFYDYQPNWYRCIRSTDAE